MDYIAIMFSNQEDYSIARNVQNAFPRARIFIEGQEQGFNLNLEKI